jgi:hypothetical protein
VSLLSGGLPADTETTSEFATQLIEGITAEEQAIMSELPPVRSIGELLTVLGEVRSRRTVYHR